MNEEELRALVREAVERHLRPQSGAARAARYDPSAQSHGTGAHGSHLLLRVSPGSEIDEGMCVIEPQVRCNHCGFCQSYGH